MTKQLYRSLPIAALALLLVVFTTACDSDTVDPDPPEPDPDDQTRVELETRGADGVILGVWTPNDGWTDADGNSISALEDPIETSAGERLPLRVGGQNASLTARFFDADGDEINIETADRVDFETLLAGANRERECSSDRGAFGAEFDVVDGQDIVAWPNVAHPDGFGDEQFAFRKDGSYPAIFHCDHIHFYPEAEGSFDVEIALGDGSIATSPITVNVGPSETEISEARIITRGGAEQTIGIWTPNGGWEDADGNAISELTDPIEDSAGDRSPLRVGGQNASLTVAFFDGDGNEITIETEDRQDMTTGEEGVNRERTCSPLNSRFAIAGGTDVIAWPSTRHPDGFGANHFAQLPDGVWVANFHCDHTHFYPLAEGSFDVEFALYDEGTSRSVNFTDPITVEVLPE